MGSAAWPALSKSLSHPLGRLLFEQCCAALRLLRAQAGSGYGRASAPMTPGLSFAIGSCLDAKTAALRLPTSVFMAWSGLEGPGPHKHSGVFYDLQALLSSLRSKVAPCALPTFVTAMLPGVRCKGRSRTNPRRITPPCPTCADDGVLCLGLGRCRGTIGDLLGRLS